MVVPAAWRASRRLQDGDRLLQRHPFGREHMFGGRNLRRAEANAVPVDEPNRLSQDVLECAGVLCLYRVRDPTGLAFQRRTIGGADSALVVTEDADDLRSHQQ